MTLDTTKMTGIKECDSKPLVTYADKFPVIELCMALTKYNRNIL